MAPKEQVNADPPMRIYIGGLTEGLADISERSLRDMFRFGEIDYVDLNKDPVTGVCRGFAYIKFRKGSDAKAAIKAMNGFEYQGKSLKVGEAPEGVRGRENYLPKSNDNDDASIFNINAQNRLALTQALTRDTYGIQMQSLPSGMTPYATPSSCYLLISNTFDPSTVNLIEEPEFYEEVSIDIREECEKFGKVEKLYLDRNSIGNIWVKFANNNVNAGNQIISAFKGR